MSTTRGIFESFPNQPATRQDSPFAVVPEPAATAAASPFTAVGRQDSPFTAVPESAVTSAASPFTAVGRQDSPFTIVDDASDLSAMGAGRSSKMPERRKTDSPFQVAEPSEGFGFEAPAKAYSSAPFEAVPAAAAAPSTTSPFSAAPLQPAASPFSVEPLGGPSQSTQAALAAFGTWQEPSVTPVSPSPVEPVAPFTTATPSVFAAVPEAPQQAPAASPSTPQQRPAPTDSFDASQSDSFSIRQIELRAIFGVDREMNVEEILQRTRALPGMRNIARVSSQDMIAIEAIKQLLPNLGFGNGGLKLYSGSVPLEFIREGSVMLAVQTDGGFAPGVRETLMLVARELGRIS